MSKIQINDLDSTNAPSFLIDLSTTESEQIAGAGWAAVAIAIIAFLVC